MEPNRREIPERASVRTPAFLPAGPIPPGVFSSALFLAGLLLASCSRGEPAVPVLEWYVFQEPSGAFSDAADSCSRASGGAYRIHLTPLPADADQQREQLVRRLAAGDSDIDLIGMDVIWTAEFAQAGWVLPWPEEEAQQVTEGRLEAAVASGRYRGRLWAAPFTTNAQLLWYRTDRVSSPPETWDDMIDMAERLGDTGRIEAQGERYEGLTVFFVSLLASAGGDVLDEGGPGNVSGPGGDTARVALTSRPTLEALRIMHRLATSGAADPGLESAREDQSRLAFESGKASFMVNYTFVWPSARENAPEVAEHIGWARWPGVFRGRPSRVTIGGVNLGIGAFSPHPELTFRAATCLASPANQRKAATRGGLPPTTLSLYDDPEVRSAFPFADILRETLRDAVQRPQTPLYSDISLAISRALHPLSGIRPRDTLVRLRKAVERALRSEGLL